ncbi:MAG: IS1634 family transposase [Acidobacteria bacterium]|nr:IS1634 family transposase [Acidobacteriota bacterium]
MPTKISADHERVDDIPVIIALLLKMRVVELIDQHFPTNGNRTGLSLGQMCVIWLTFILTQADHRLNQVQPWVAEHQTTLSRCLDCEVQARDCTDDRLAAGLDYLSVDENWGSFETDLNRTVIRVYDLRTQQVRIDTTTASAFVTPDGMFQLGYSKDHRPDLPQLKIPLSVLDPLGLPLTTTVMAGNCADDPLYLPEIRKVRQSIGRSGLTYIGDCKISALATRAQIVAQNDYYLCPLSALQMPAAELDRLLEPVFAKKQKLQKVFASQADGLDCEPPAKEDLIAVGFEYSVRLSGKDQSGTLHSWDERRFVVRSLSLAQRQEKSLRERINRAQKEIKALNERKQGKPILRSVEQAQEAAERILEAHRVGEYLRIEVKAEVQERTKRRYGARPATSVCEERFTVQSKVEKKALEEAIRRLGWRVYATNQGANELSLEQAVWAYREQYLVEQCFGRLKGCPLSLTPLYLQYEHRCVGLILLLTIALRVLVLGQFVVRKNLKEQGQKLSGIYAGQPGRQTSSPTTEMMLRAFRGVTLSRLSVDGETHWHLSPLSETQKRILKLLGLPSRTFSKLIPTISKTDFQSREP